MIVRYCWLVWGWRLESILPASSDEVGRLSFRGLKQSADWTIGLRCGAVQRHKCWVGHHCVKKD